VNARRKVSSQDSQNDSHAEMFPAPDFVRNLFSGIGSCEQGGTAMFEVAGAARLSGREQSQESLCSPCSHSEPEHSVSALGLGAFGVWSVRTIRAASACRAAVRQQQRSGVTCQSFPCGECGDCCGGIKNPAH
jgi:hypothetical protein